MSTKLKRDIEKAEEILQRLPKGYSHSKDDVYSSSGSAYFVISNKKNEVVGSALLEAGFRIEADLREPTYMHFYLKPGVAETKKLINFLTAEGFSEATRQNDNFGGNFKVGLHYQKSLNGDTR